MVVAVISAARWLRAPDLPYLGVAVGATVAAVWLSFRRRGMTASLVMAGFALVAMADQYSILRLERDWSAMSASITRNAQTTARATLNDLAETLHATALQALSAPNDPGDAFRALSASLKPERYATEQGVVLYRAGAPVAWAGRIRAVPSDDDSAAYTVTWSDFYVTLQASVTRNGSRAVASALLHADPPADRLARALDEWIVQRTGVLGFAFNRPVAPFVGDVFAPGGTGLLSIEPLPPRIDAVRPRIIDRSRRHGVVLLALALIAFIGAEWHPRAALGRRLAALAVPILGLVIVPLNTLSNVSPLLDPTYFYSPIGGPLTASVGALALTSAIAALGALAIIQAGIRIRPRVLAGALALLIAGATPFLVHALAEGITSPGSGVPLEVWIVWQVTLALTGTALLALAVVAGRSAMVTPAGLPPGVAIGLAITAAALGVLFWQPVMPWPPVYAGLWIAAGMAAAFAAGSRPKVVIASVVAGSGAALLIWSANAERRIALAERDVAGLTTPDPNATLLLERFGADLAVEAPPHSRADLLKLYARSDLAAGGYPVALTEWSPDGDTLATLQLAQFATASQQVARAVNEARAGDSTVIMEAAGSPGVQLVLAAPGPTHAVTTVVVAPTTRLITPSADARLLGIAPDVSNAPPYTLTPIRVAGHADTLLARGLTRRWTRTGEQLHADWLVGGALGSARAHVEIDLRTVDALAERGTLLLLLDLIVIGMLWMVAAITGGAFWRWLRWRARRWAHSYRAQLTVVLFAFFVTPALVFAAWSYRRLATDDRQSHALRVLETLRSVVNNGEVEFLQVAGNRLDTPLLLYRGGQLSGTSDTLLAELAPIGAFLRPDIQLGLGLAEEVTADRVERLDATTALFGYRAATDDRGEHVVLAAPSGADVVEDAALTRRRDDLSILLMFATVMGAVAALWLSGLAAREFARPIDALRRAALAAAAGAREPDLGGEPPAEFIPVFSAFRRMAADFGASQRVLAWGQMARQVAHEIKNPLTPIRLGVQHLQRAHADKRKDFDRILQQNATRILAEIDRLDEIARAFSRYGTAPEERPPAQATDVGAVVRDVVDLERLGAEGGVQFSITTNGTLIAQSRADDLREVLLNLLENARLAHAHHVRVDAVRDSARVIISVRDDGDGIPDDVMPRIFEPHFSTRTSGSGLGLAVSRRLVDGWGGTIAVESQPGQGTTVTVSLVVS
jgi:two-component system nitrogen regulation sensor histidine kinase NtrY